MTTGLFAYATSHRIDEVAPGVLRKDLGVLLDGAQHAKPAFVHDPAREPAMYREVLGSSGIGPRCIASGDDWIEIERIDAPALWQVGDIDTWVDVAAWMATMHRRLSACDTGAVPLLRHDGVLFAAWRHRAAFAGVPEAVLTAHLRASQRLAELPTTVLHGDLYPSNVLAGDGGVWPVDWELAGTGPAVLDLAALTAGHGLADTTRTAMARAYVEVVGGDWSTWREDLDAARLHLCVQWLGWSSSWTPPPEHRHDWLREALELATR